MADPKERRRTPRKTAAATPKPDTQAALSASNIRGDAAPQEIRRLIAEAAYFRAQERGFQPGHELEDWIEAESEVMGRLNAGER
jgi:hypothetical protein